MTLREINILFTTQEMYDHNLKSLKEYVENKEVWQMASDGYGVVER